jgi:hypothetical protein
MVITYTAQESYECSYCGERISRSENFVIEGNQIRHEECHSENLKQEDYKE